ncbi:MAG: pantothenate kinase [Synechococcales cyanobacterium C42_A2020_086]|jgi:type III pantothenate kinase|nr:pantothenate kinase [Synechococcales cyanobacterium C42_A2020_086]
MNLRDQAWLALLIGNSRLHWAWFQTGRLQQAWDTAHLSPEAIAVLLDHHVDLQICHVAPPDQARVPLSLPLVLASVVPAQLPLWQAYANTYTIHLEHIPLQGLYPTLGIDRALALLGAAKTYGFPVLVIDAGTSLTFTGLDHQRRLVGGAILPGLGLQLRSLAQHTAALPLIPSPADSLPLRWATHTEAAMQSGVVYTLLAGLRDFIAAWQQQFAETKIILTGGDAPLIAVLLRQQSPELAAVIQVDLQLIFLGMQQVVAQQ